MKRNIFLTFLAIWITAASLIFAKPCLCDQNASPESLSPYPKLPYKELIFKPREHLVFKTPCVTELPDGSLLAAWTRSMPWRYNTGIWSSRRPVGADSWTEPSMVHNASGLDDKNPVFYLGQDNKLRLLWTFQRNPSKWWHNDILKIMVSNDLGYTWEKPNEFGVSAGFLSRSRPITLQNGWLVMPIYMDANASSAIVTSKDGGLTWGKPKWILSFFGIEPTIIQRPDLSLFALMRSGTPPRRSWEVVSKDLGLTWSWGISDVQNPSSAIEMVKLRNGHVVLAFNDSKKNRSNLSLALSYDYGKTWAHIRAIENKPGCVYDYPSIIQDKQGLIHVIYAYDGRNIAHFVTNEEWIEGKGDSI